MNERDSILDATTEMAKILKNENYKNYIYINFDEIPEYREIFAGNL